MTQAEEWINRHNNGEIPPEPPLRIVFPDGSAAERGPGDYSWDTAATFPKTSAADEQGRKDDSTKPRWSLLPYRTIEQVIKVLEFGATKYKVDNWMHVEDPQRRYYDAVMRHIESWRNREKNDPDSGLPHLAHAVCSLLFLMWFDGRDETT